MISTYPPPAAACMAVFPLALTTCWFGSHPPTTEKNNTRIFTGLGENKLLINNQN